MLSAVGKQKIDQQRTKGIESGEISVFSKVKEIALTEILQSEQSPKGIHSFSQWLTHSLSQVFIHSVNPSITHSPIQEFLKSLSHLLAASLIQTFSHELTHPAVSQTLSSFHFHPPTCHPRCPLLDLCIDGSHSLKYYFYASLPIALGLQSALWEASLTCSL